jgi:hypothetical protein
MMATIGKVQEIGRIEYEDYTLMFSYHDGVFINSGEGWRKWTGDVYKYGVSALERYAIYMSQYDKTRRSNPHYTPFITYFHSKVSLKNRRTILSLLITHDGNADKVIQSLNEQTLYSHNKPIADDDIKILCSLYKTMNKYPKSKMIKK